MEYKLQINQFTREDLEYKLVIRGVSAKSSVDEMRTLLRHFNRLSSSSSSFVKPAYPFTFEQDATAIKAKLDLIESLIKEFTGTCQSPEFDKVSTALAFVYGRIDNSQPQITEETKQRPDFLVKSLQLSSLLTSMLKKQRQSTLVQTSNVLSLDVTDANIDSSNFDSSDADMVSQPSQSGAPVAPVLKLVHVASWGIKFSGQVRELFVGAYLERVNELKLARNSSDAILFNPLMAGDAYTQHYIPEFILVLNEV